MSTIFHSTASTAASQAMSLLTPGRTTQTPVANLLTTGSTKIAANSAKADASSSSTSSSTSDSADDITSSDFLTLLVSELQNQDPTQPTDPNTYVQQLVGVNSLQQLISINQELGTATGSSSSTNSTSTNASTAV